jgi:hypothetical protein
MIIDLDTEVVDLGGPLDETFLCPDYSRSLEPRPNHTEGGNTVKCYCFPPAKAELGSYVAGLHVFSSRKALMQFAYRFPQCLLASDAFINDVIEKLGLAKGTNAHNWYGFVVQF